MNNGSVAALADHHEVEGYEDVEVSLFKTTEVPRVRQWREAQEKSFEQDLRLPIWKAKE